MAVSLVEKSTAQIRAEIAELEAQLAAATPEEPVLTGSVVRFNKYRGAYTFAALKTPNGMWYLTQDGSRSARQGYAPKDWPTLLTFIGGNNWHTLEVLS